MRKSFLADDSLRSRVMYQFGRGLVVAFVRLCSWITIDGREHIPKTGAFVLAPVHRSYLDTPYAACVTRRRMRFMGKAEMWDNKLFGWALSTVGAFPVDRGASDLEAMKRALRIVKAGEPLVLFPEGERRTGPTITEIFEGAAFVAVKAGVPIIPVGIGGSEKVMPPGGKIRPGRVHISIGEPIMPPTPAPGSRLPKGAHREVGAELQQRLQELFDDAMQRVPWDYPLAHANSTEPA